MPRSEVVRMSEADLVFLRGCAGAPPLHCSIPDTFGENQPVLPRPLHRSTINRPARIRAGQGDGPGPCHRP